MSSSNARIFSNALMFLLVINETASDYATFLLKSNLGMSLDSYSSFNLIVILLYLHAILDSSFYFEITNFSCSLFSSRVLLTGTISFQRSANTSQIIDCYFKWYPHPTKYRFNETCIDVGKSSSMQIAVPFFI